MRRRELITGALAGALCSAGELRLDVMAAQPTAEEMARRAREYRERALEAFSFELLETAGNRALSTREQLKGAGRGFPVVIGDEDSLNHLLDHFSPVWPNQRSVAEILAAAAAI
jgi:hypothetical protein